MSVLREAGAALSRSCRKIFYLVSDDYDIIPRFIDSNPAVFGQCMRGKISEDYFVGPGTYKRLSRMYVEDIHYLLKAPIFTDEDGKGKQQRQGVEAGKEGNVKRENQVKRKFNDKACIFICADFHLLKEAEQGRLLKQFLDYTEKKECMLLLSSPILTLPGGYEQVVEVVDMPGPDEEDIREQLLAYAQSGGRKEKLEDSARERIMEAAGDFKGLNFHEIEAILYEMTGKYGSFYGRSAQQKHVPMGDDYKLIAKERRKRIDLAKKEKARKDSTVTILESGDHVAGLGKYKKWLLDRKDTIKNPDEARRKGREPIRGVLMTGLPGTGKTQGAKYTAHELGVPLVQLRIDNLLGGLVGDSEKNFKRYRKQVEMLAPCVVLIDEIEKLFSDERSGNGGSSEVKMNIFTALLDWMQENKKRIFFYATCNSVKNLPPELLRDGRFSMRFCVFMPTYQELVEIIQFHMKRVNDLSGGEVFGASEGIVNRHGDISPKAAEKFLKDITEDGKREKRNMFFTGANIEALINEVQYCSPDGKIAHMKMQNYGCNGKIAYIRTQDYDHDDKIMHMRTQDYDHDDKVMHMRTQDYGRNGKITDIDRYAGAMCDVAKSEFCQPYGETNLKNVVDFWIDALENNFTDAADYGKDDNGKDRQAPLSFRRFDRQEGVFRSDGLIFDNDNIYDRYLYEIFSEKIQQEYAKRGRDEHDMLEKISQKLDRLNQR